MDFLFCRKTTETWDGDDETIESLFLIVPQTTTQRLP